MEAVKESEFSAVFEASFSELYDYHPPRRGEIREGIILSVERDRILVDVAAKRDGIVPKQDLEILGEEAVAKLAVGGRVPVFVMNPRDREGELLVSINLARQEADWERAQELLESKGVWEGEVVGYNRGGLLVSFGHIEGFVPQSHVVALPRGLSPEERRERLAGFVGESLPLKVIEIDRDRRRLVLSNREAIKDWREAQREHLLEELSEGDIVHGTVSNMRDFGAFVDLGGADGLLHISELAWHYVDHPSDVLKEGQEIDVYVLELDHERKRIALSLKRLQPDPWSLVEERYTPGDVVEGTVTNVVDFGAFVRLEEGVEGLVHVSEMPEGLSPEEAVSPDERIVVRVLSIDADRQQIGLSLRRVASWKREMWQAQQEEEQDGLTPAPEQHGRPTARDEAAADVESSHHDEAVGTDVAMPAQQ